LSQRSAGQLRDYAPVEALEQDYVKRLSGVRLAHGGSDVVVDLLFASSGIENEVVANADRLEVLPRLVVPVATTPHLIALKVLPGAARTLPILATSSRQRHPQNSMPPVKLSSSSRHAGSTEDRTSSPTWKSL
jgi:hypothetical protein